jgi:hypothetical protein
MLLHLPVAIMATLSPRRRFWRDIFVRNLSLAGQELLEPTLTTELISCGTSIYASDEQVAQRVAKPI